MNSAIRALILCGLIVLWGPNGIVVHSGESSPVPQQLSQAEFYLQSAALWRSAAAQHRAVGCTGLAACEERMALWEDCQAAALMGGKQISIGSAPGKVMAPPACVLSSEPSMDGCPPCDMRQKTGVGASATAAGIGNVKQPGALVSPDSIPKEIGYTGPVAPRVERHVSMHAGEPDPVATAVVPSTALKDLAAGRLAEREAKYGRLDLDAPLPTELVKDALDRIGRGVDSFGKAPDMRVSVSGAQTPSSTATPLTLTGGGPGGVAAVTGEPAAPAGTGPAPAAARGWGAESIFGKYLQPNAPPATTAIYGGGGVSVSELERDESVSQRPTDLLSDATIIPGRGVRSARQIAGAVSYHAGEAVGYALLDSDSRDRVRREPNADDNILVPGPGERLFDRFVRVVNFPVYVVKKFNEGLLNPALKSIYSALDEFGRAPDGGR